MGCNCRGWPDEDVAESEIVIVEVPEGVTTGGGGVVTAALPPPQPETANVMQRMVAERTPRRTRRFLRAASWNARRSLPRIVNKKNRASTIGANKGTCGAGGRRSGADGGNWAEPLVVTATVKVAAPLASETLAGTWQTAPRGAPLQLSETAPVKPAPGVS